MREDGKKTTGMNDRANEAQEMEEKCIRTIRRNYLERGINKIRSNSEVSTETRKMAEVERRRKR